MDAVSHYLNQILAPRLRSYGVSERFLLYTIDIINTQMTSLLRHWDDRVFRNTVLLLGLEERSYYDPPCKIDVRCFVVVTIRNSPIETIQSNAYAEAGLSKYLSNQDVKDLTSEAIRYFSAQDFAAMCKQAKSSTKTDLYLHLKQQHPVTWTALEKLATTSAKAVDYPKVSIDKAFVLDNLDGDAEIAVESGKLEVGIYDGYTPEIEPPLKAYLKMLLEGPNGMLVVDSLKSLTRNITKLLDVLEFLLTRGLIFASTNYYLENGHVERRIKPLRAGHSTIEMQKNTSNLAGLGYRHKTALSHFAKSSQ